MNRYFGTRHYYFIDMNINCKNIICFIFGTGDLTLDGAHHGNKATNSNREYSAEHVFTIAMNIFAMANGFVLYVIMKVEIHSHVVISFSSIKHART